MEGLTISKKESDQISNVLEVYNLSKIYKTAAGNVVALRNVSFSIPKGAIEFGESSPATMTLRGCNFSAVTETVNSYILVA